MTRKPPPKARLRHTKRRSHGNLVKNYSGLWERTRVRRPHCEASGKAYHRCLYYISEDQDSLSIYYSLLRSYANKYKQPTWYIESLILRFFTGSIQPDSYAWDPLRVELDVLLNTPKKEIDKVIARWHDRRVAFKKLLHDRVYLQTED